MDDQYPRTRQARRGRVIRRAVALAVLAAVVALGGGSEPLRPPSPRLQPVSITDPVPPTNVVVTGADRALGVSWTASTESLVTGYRVYLDGALAASPATTSATITSLVNGRAYTVTVRTVTTVVGTSYEGTTASTPMTGTPRDSVPPAAPTGLAATRGDGQVTLSWTANSTDNDADGYRVLRDDVPVTGLLSGVGTTGHVDLGLINDRSYAYRVQTHDTSGNWSSSSPAVTATPTDLTAPAAPTGLVAARGDGQVTLSWTANAEPDVAAYRLLRDGVVVATVPGTDTSRVDTGLTNDLAYRYTLIAVDGHGNPSVESAAATGTPTDLTAPAAPTGLVAARGDGQVRLSWSANAEPDVASYRVLRNGVEVAAVPAPGTSHVDTGLVNDTAYRWSLVAVDGHGNRSVESASVTATPTDLTAPAAPTGLAATAGEGRVRLSWSANAEPDVASYRVLRNGVEVAAVPAPGTSHVDTGLVNGTAYRWSLVAVDGHGNRSVESASVTATPTDVAAAAPTGVSASPGDRQAYLRWAAAPEPDVVAYRVLAADGSTAATATAPATQATVPGLTNGATYRFTVVAVDAGGNVSAPSAEVAVVPALGVVPVEGAGESGGLAASNDGRYVVVGTRARLEATDTNTAYELYLFDRQRGTRLRIAPLPATATGATDPTNTAAPAISDDGRYIALATTAALVPGDRNRLADVYRLDTTTGSWAPVSVPSSGAVSATTAGTVLQGGPSVHATSPSVALSADGNLVVFYSGRADLVTRDTNGVVDVFAKDMTSGAVSRLSTTATGADIPRIATGPALALTPDGRFALFTAASSTGPVVLYRKTLSGEGAGALVVVSSVPASGRAVEYGVFRDAGDVALSDDGRYVALVTSAKLGTPTPTASWGVGLAYRVDTVTGAVAALGDGQRTAWEHQVALDPTGRYGFFATTAAEVPGDGNGHTDHLRRDLAGGVPGPLVLVTADAEGRATAGPTGSITPAEYGRLLPVTGDEVLVTTSQALFPTDTNRLRDLYVKDLAGGVVGTPVG